MAVVAEIESPLLLGGSPPRLSLFDSHFPGLRWPHTRSPMPFEATGNIDEAVAGWRTGVGCRRAGADRAPTTPIGGRALMTPIGRVVTEIEAPTP
ncbi:hypothetical protein CRG98_006865 [Punica granatum]|uniref:Uncharacterized protein n=1 Tax=Punica granatum TaxID=22663 RepID=A0A2I0KWS4_PUNGR|nr:hypothetical protein CRG98_006865 [Punica granatum]